MVNGNSQIRMANEKWKYITPDVFFTCELIVNSKTAHAVGMGLDDLVETTFHMLYPPKHHC